MSSHVFVDIVLHFQPRLTKLLHSKSRVLRMCSVVLTIRLCRGAFTLERIPGCG